MSEVGRALLLKLLQQVDRGGRDTLPLSPRFAAGYFSDSSLTTAS